ncbi:MAG: hypothetical protein IJ545_06195 [Alphaproteobacteria bacterium]|nr:hypothetical protein [Alphaproteobacteria bacterium]
MKKIIIYFLAVLMVLFCISCTSAPVHPKIIGCAKIQYAPDDDLYFIDVDNNLHEVVHIIDNKALLSGDKQIPPREGVLVTAFVTANDSQIQFIKGNLNKKDIEAAFSKDYTLFWLLVLGLSWLFYLNRKKEKLSHYD